MAAKKLARGGLEIGGILLGAREQGVTRVLAARSLECEHRFGPSFVLSGNDFSLLEQMLAEFRSDPELSSLEPLGAYFSHSRHGAADLTETEIELYKRFFADSFPLTFVLIPRPSGLSVQVNLFARGSNGAHISCDEFDYSIFTAEPHDEGSPSQRTGEEATSVLRRVAGEQVPREQVPREIDFRIVPPDEVANAALRNTTGGRALTLTSPPSKNSWSAAAIWVFIALLALAGAGVAYLVWPAGPSTIPLTTVERDGDLVIHWDPNLRAFQDASEGAIDIQDGSKKATHVSLDAKTLREGSIVYRRESEIVRISFKVGGQELTGLGTTIFMVAKGDAPAAPNTTPAPPAPVPTSVATGPSSVASSPSSVPPSPPATSSKPSSALPPPQREEPRRRFQAPALAQVKSPNSRPAALPEPPALGGAPVASLSPFTVPALPAPAPPPPAPVAAAPATSAAVPTSGRLIWTGQLAKRAILSFSSTGASAGHLSGWFPPKLPVRVSVHPGELIDGGIVIFTKGEAPRSESPNPGNGWNTVIYKRDDAAAGDFEMLEAPGTANGWNQLVLRNGNRKLSILVLDWSAAK